MHQKIIEYTLISSARPGKDVDIKEVKRQLLPRLKRIVKRNLTKDWDVTDRGGKIMAEKKGHTQYILAEVDIDSQKDHNGEYTITARAWFETEEVMVNERVIFGILRVIASVISTQAVFLVEII